MARPFPSRRNNPMLGHDGATMTPARKIEAENQPDPSRWLLLAYRIPSEPTRLRAGVWRKLKGLGSIYLQNSSAALPASAQAERSLRSIRAEIGEMGGVAYLFDAKLLAGQTQLVSDFNAARDTEYEEIIDRCEDFLRQVSKEWEASRLHLRRARRERCGSGEVEGVARANPRP